jgi:hypothetical protein
LLNFKWSDYAFYLNHLGLLVLLYSAGLGAADLRRYVMHVEEGATEWRVYNEKDDVLELPVAIKLNDFYMEEYIPKLAIIDRRTGDAIPKKNPQMWQIDTLKTKSNIAGWSIQLEKYIHEAVRNSIQKLTASHAQVLALRAQEKEISAITRQLRLYERSRIRFGDALRKLPEDVPENIQLTEIRVPPPPPASAALLNRNWPIRFSSTTADWVCLMLAPGARLSTSPPGSRPTYWSPSQELAVCPTDMAKA